MKSDLLILSMGGGVQSSCLGMMATHGEIEKPDYAVFADTGDESQATYKWLDWLESRMSFPLIRCNNGEKLSEHVYKAIENKTRVSNPPLFTKGDDGKMEGLLTRDCTGDFKVAVIQRQVRVLMKKHNVKKVRQWIGMSLDEVYRMKPSRVQYSKHEWPLIDMRMTRHDCKRWMARHGYPEPPRSACVYCPHHSNAEWKRIKTEDSEGWDRAVYFDSQIRTGINKVRAKCFLHRSCVPLEDVDLSDDSDNGQGLLWGDECEGMCGV